MKTVTDFPRSVTIHDDIAIAMPDGTRLSARLWLPDDAEADLVPAILEHLPYRKRDGTAARDELTHPYLAGHGYACLRVDMRGNGDSEGLMEDEYTQTEWDDALAVMAWLRNQPWCTGKLGMMGISWGGFNALQLAALRPEGLEAVIALCTTVDRYADDIHYKGGAMLGENLGWAAQMLAYSSRPPDPEIAGEHWRDLWLQRLKAQRFLLETWLSHQTRDDYWRHGSVCEDYAAIRVPVLAFGGWHDGYRNAPGALVRNLSSPAKAIVGPWIHKYPHFAGPEPRIGFLQEALRWWDHWLKGADTGVENDPRERLWLMDSVAPERWIDERSGRWIALDEDAPRLTMHLSETTMGDIPGRFERRVETPQNCGRGAGEYFPFAFGPELPDDQTEDDELSVHFDAAPAAQDTDIVGAPTLHMQLTPHAPGGLVAVRLCDLRPDGTSALITHGFMNLSHWKSHAEPEDLTPGQEINLTVTLDRCAYRLPEGHRLRLAVSSSYWPFLWPLPDAEGFTLTGGALSLPVRDTAGGDEWTFEPPEAAAPRRIHSLREATMTRRVETADDGTETIIIEIDDGKVRDMRHGLETGSRCSERWSIRADDPMSAHAEIEWETTTGRGDWQVRTECVASLRATADTWFTRARIRAWEGDALIFEKAFVRDIGRRFA